jgi:CBS domain-containing protein
MTVTLNDHVDVMRRAPVTVSPDASLREVARTLWEAEVGAVVVVVKGQAVGLLSERDIVDRLAQGADPDATVATGAMTNAVTSARPGDRFLDVALQMLDQHVRHIPVVDEYGRATGMVSVRDLLRPLLLDALGGHGASEEADTAG